jgi:hypothetical protein
LDKRGCRHQNLPRGVPEVDQLSRCTFVFVDQAAKDIAAVELPGDQRFCLVIAL